MKYAIVKVINGNYSIHAEGITNIDSAKTQFHGLCQTLWNASDVDTAEVMIADENLDCVDGYREFITHIAPTPVTIVSISKVGNVYTVTFSDGTIMTYTEE
jgi:hypothetical protein